MQGNQLLKQEIRKRKADEVNDKQVTGRSRGASKWKEGTPCSFDDCGASSSAKIDEIGVGDFSVIDGHLGNDDLLETNEISYLTWIRVREVWSTHSLS
ncbi:hypothetical protein Tco_1272025 [Tanacetum coccineum]